MRQWIQYAVMSAILFSSWGLMACSDDDPVLPDAEVPVQPGSGSDGSEDGSSEETPMGRDITIRIGDMSFSATLADNDAARAFAALLPLTMQMSELNGNEKYYYLDDSLPTETYRPGTIQAGDLMLYGSSCVVLFYETFSSGYNYTRLGRIDDPEGLDEAAGSGDVEVRLEMRTTSE